MNVFKKIKRHFKRLQKHPMTHTNPYVGLVRYLYFNVKSSIIKEQIMTWLGDLRFFVRRGDAGLVGNIYYGLYEFEESLFLLHLLRKEDVFMDIGANLGHYSLLVSGLKKCKTIAVEPVPATFNQFVRNIELNKLQDLIEPIQKGIANTNDTLYFSSDRNTMDRIVKANYPYAVKVSVTTLDSIAKKTPTAMKLDVEGYEYFALIGAKNILKATELKVVILELNQSGNKYGIEDDTTYQLLLDHGFKPFEYNYKNRKLSSVDSYNKDKFNTLFIRDLSFVQTRVSESPKIKICNDTY